MVLSNVSFYQHDIGSLIPHIIHTSLQKSLVESCHAVFVFSSWISSSLQRFGEVTFDSLLPSEADRTTAAHTLHKLLGEEIKSECTRFWNRYSVESNNGNKHQQSENVRIVCHLQARLDSSSFRQ